MGCLQVKGAKLPELPELLDLPDLLEPPEPEAPSNVKFIFDMMLPIQGIVVSQDEDGQKRQSYVDLARIQERIDNKAKSLERFKRTGHRAQDMEEMGGDTPPLAICGFKFHDCIVSAKDSDIDLLRDPQGMKVKLCGSLLFPPDIDIDRWYETTKQLQLLTAKKEREASKRDQMQREKPNSNNLASTQHVDDDDDEDGLHDTGDGERWELPVKINGFIRSRNSAFVEDKCSRNSSSSRNSTDGHLSRMQSTYSQSKRADIVLDASCDDLVADSQSVCGGDAMLGIWLPVTKVLETVEMELDISLKAVCKVI